MALPGHPGPAGCYDLAAAARRASNSASVDVIRVSLDAPAIRRVPTWAPDRQATSYVRSRPAMVKLNNVAAFPNPATERPPNATERSMLSKEL